MKEQFRRWFSPVRSRWLSGWVVLVFVLIPAWCPAENGGDAQCLYRIATAIQSDYAAMSSLSDPYYQIPKKCFWVAVSSGVAVLGMVGVLVLFLCFRNRVDRTLRKKEQQLRHLVEISNGWIWETDAGGWFTYTSPQVEKFLGYKPDELIGKHAASLVPDAEVEQSIGAMTKLTEEKKPFRQIETYCLHKDGHKVFLETSGIPILGKKGVLLGYFGIDRDITAQKIIERDVARQQAEVDSIFRASPVGIGLAIDRIIVQGNNRMCEISGYSADELIGKSVRLFYPTQEEYEYVGRVGYDWKSGVDVGHIETRWQRKDGQIVNVLMNSAPVDIHDPSKGAIFTVMDVTKAKAAEKKIDQQQAELRSIFRASPVGFGLTHDRKLIRANDRFFDIAGYPQEEMLGLSPRRYYPTDAEYEAVGRKYEAAAAQGTARIETRWVRKGGTIIDVVIYLAIVDANNPDEGFAIVIQDITDRKAAEQQLRKSEAALRKANRIAQMGNYEMDLKSEVFTVSDDIRKWFGFAPGEQVTLEKVLARAVAKDRPLITQSIEQAVATGLTEQDLRFKMPSGEIRWLYTQGEASYGPQGEPVSLFGIIQDITDRKAAEQKLLFTQFATDHAGDAAYWMKKDARFIYVNEAACQALGYTRDELLSMDVFDISPNFPKERWPQHWQDIREEKSTYIETYHRRKDGTLFPVAIIGNFVDYDGNEYNCVFARDITRKKADEQKRQILMQQLRNRNNELQSIVFTAAHDLRSPLVNIAGFTGELEKDLAQLVEILDAVPLAGAVAERVNSLIRTDLPESLRFIKFGNQQMDMLLGGLMRLSRVGSAPMKMVSLDMNKMFAAVVRGFQYQVKTLGIDISIQDDLPDCIGDYSLLVQVFINLLDNAIKYRHPDRKTVITIGGCLRDDIVEYTLADNGIGIEPEHVEKVFDLFHRLGPKQESDGEGLGLTIVRRILDRMGGRVRINSTPGEGTTVLVRLSEI